MTLLDHLRVCEGDARPLPRPAPVREGFDPDRTWQARLDWFEEHAPRGRCGWRLALALWTAALLSAALSIWLGFAAVEGVASLIEAARAAPTKAMW